MESSCIWHPYLLESVNTDVMVWGELLGSAQFTKNFQVKLTLRGTWIDNSDQ